MATRDRIQSDLLIHPGEELSEVLQTIGMSQLELANRTGLSRKHINRIIKAKEGISSKVAILLERVLGTPASFWINVSRNYELDLSRREAESSLKSSVQEIRRFPIAEMIRLGWLKKAASKLETAQQLLSFFAVADFRVLESEWNQRFAAAYRKANGKNASREALAVWIRAGQIEAAKRDLPKYNEVILRKCVAHIRMSTRKVKTFGTETAHYLQKAGVALVLVPHLKGTYANGATYWIENGSRPVIQLSIRHKWCDIVFFSLFHEIGHILRHPRTGMFIEDHARGNKLEDEADEFAADALIPSNEFRRFVEDENIISPERVESFANKLRIHPCVVIGRLQKEKLIQYHDKRFHHMKPRFEWAGN